MYLNEGNTTTVTSHKRLTVTLDVFKYFQRSGFLDANLD